MSQPARCRSVGLGTSARLAYKSLSDEPLIVDELSAVRHVFRYQYESQGSYGTIVGVVIVARRGNNVVVLMGEVLESTYESQKAILDEIAGSLRVK